MKHALAIFAILFLLSAPAMADETGIVGIGVDRETAKDIGGWLKTLLTAGGGAGLIAAWQKLKKPDTKPVDPVNPDGGKFDPAKIIDILKDLIDGKTPGPVDPRPNPLPFPVPADLQRYLDFIAQTKGLHDDIKTKGQPVGVDAEFHFADGSVRTVVIGTKTAPAPVAA